MSNEKYYERFNLSQRIEHWILVLSFTVLAVTGLPQKFAGDGWAETIIALLGGIETTRLLHHFAAAILLVEAAYHALVIGYKMFVLRVRWTMFPGMQDVQDAIAAVRYNLGLSANPPEYDRYSFAEKAEYWALIWGTAIMAFTGFMLWNPLTTTRFFQGDVIPAAKAAHGAEAILAVLAIVVWHVYNVHVKLFNKSMLIGKMSEREMQEEHALELARMDQSKPEWKPSPQQIAHWRLVFTPIAAIVAVALALGIYFFLAGETTAISTLPKRATIQVYVPQTPTPTAALARTGTPAPGQTQVPAGATPQTVGQAKPLPADHAGRAVCQVCHNTGVGGAPKSPADHAGRLDAACADCHKPK
jgi:formate dehydrogenase gamma subunit